jgi:hypothetical protein
MWPGKIMMKCNFVKMALVMVVLTACLNGQAAEPVVDKSQYHLFNPTPSKLMREMATDRPDKTESPYTVDAGHLQIESDIINASFDHDTAAGADTRIRSLAFSTLNLKVGLCNRADLQLVVPTWNHVRTDDRVAGTLTKQSGFGDITARLKVNLWGNDGGTTALGIMPFAKFPSNVDGLGNKEYEGGLIVPLAIAISENWSLGLMTELDVVRDTAGNSWHPESINTITVSRPIWGPVSAYLEFFSAVSTERGTPWVGTVDFGFTWGITENMQLDIGANIGVTRSAEDLNPFIGFSFRY